MAGYWLLATSVTGHLRASRTLTIPSHSTSLANIPVASLQAVYAIGGSESLEKALATCIELMLAEHGLGVGGEGALDRQANCTLLHYCSLHCVLGALPSLCIQLCHFNQSHYY